MPAHPEVTGIQLGPLVFHPLAVCAQRPPEPLPPWVHHNLSAAGGPGPLAPMLRLLTCSVLLPAWPGGLRHEGTELLEVAISLCHRIRSLTVLFFEVRNLHLWQHGAATANPWLVMLWSVTTMSC